MPSTVLTENTRDFEVALVELDPFKWELFVWYRSEWGMNTKVYGETLTTETTARETFRTVCNYLRYGGFELVFKISDHV
jgi:hypothetical protein